MPTGINRTWRGAREGAQSSSVKWIRTSSSEQRREGRLGGCSTGVFLKRTSLFLAKSRREAYTEEEDVEGRI